MDSLSLGMIEIDEVVVVVITLQVVFSGRKHSHVCERENDSAKFASESKLVAANTDILTAVAVPFGHHLFNHRRQLFGELYNE